jgi:thioredoxin reductase (NADPH)
MKTFDLIVIGQGYAGLTAAKLASELGLSVAAIEATFPGGLVTNVNELDPWPEGEAHSGSDLTSTIAMANDAAGVVAVSSAVVAVSRADQGHWLVETEDGENYTAAKLIVASGAHFRKLGVPGEAELFGRGVSECADCDGPLYRGQEALVVGGGDSAFQEASILSRFASKVTILMRGDAPRARQGLVEAARENPKIVVRPNTQITEVLGDETGVTGVRLQDGEALACTGVFVFVGLEANTGFLPAEVGRDAAGGVITDDELMSSALGLYAVGAARGGFGGLLCHARADAECAVTAAARKGAAPNARPSDAPGIQADWSDDRALPELAEPSDSAAYPPEVVANLLTEGRLEAQVAAERGALRDLSLDEVVVHIGAPMGAVSGWVGSTFWQVWVEPGDPIGHVHVRIAGGPKHLWRLEGDFPRAQILDAAKDRAVALVKQTRQAQRSAAERRLSQLKAALA